MKTPRILLACSLLCGAFAAPAETADEAAARSAAAAYANALSAGDLETVWASLPATWRSSAGQAVKALGAKAKENPAVWTAARDCLLEVSATLAKKSGYAANLLSRSVSPVAACTVEGDGQSPAIVRTAAKLGAIAKAATPGVLSSGGIDTLLAMAPLSLPGVTDALPPPASVSDSALAAKANADGSVTVGIPGGGSSQTVKMVKAGESWVPAPLAEIFAGSASWKSAISSVALDGTSAAGIVSALGMLRKTAASAAKATSQEQFDKSTTAAAFPLLMLGSAASGQAAGGGASNPADLLKAFMK